ncbi:hypothetical protein [Enterobacter sp. UPMP2052]
MQIDLTKWVSKRSLPSKEKIFLEGIYDSKDWEQLRREVKIQTTLITPELREAFHLLWIEKGHFIRQHLGCDDVVLDILRTFLPPYTGDGQYLFRGENVDRFKCSTIGFCWTQCEKKARQFASGLNACGCGGLLLKAWVPATSILADVHPHSIYLGEYEVTVDSAGVEQLEVIEQYPPSH